MEDLSVQKAILSVGLFFLVGCAGTTITTPLDTAANGFRYSLPVSRLNLEVEKTTTFPSDAVFNQTAVVTMRANERLSIITQGFLETCYSTGVAYSVSRVLGSEFETIADTSQVYSIQIEPGTFADGSVTLIRNERGLLKSVNAKLTGKAGEALKTSAKFLARVIGYTTSVPSVLPTDTSLLPQNEKFNLFGVPIDESCEAVRAKLISAAGLNEIVTPLMPETQVIGLLTGRIKPEWFQAVDRLKKGVTASQQNIEEMTQKAASSKSAKEKKSLLESIALEEQLKTKLERQLSRYTGYINASDKKIKSNYGVKPPETETLNRSYAISDIIVDTTSDGTLDLAEFEEIGVAPVLERINQSVATSLTRADTTDEAFIAYRDPEPFIFKLYAAQPPERPFTKSSSAANTGVQWKVSSSEVVNVIAPDSPIGRIAYEENAWSKRDLQLTINDDGFITTAKYDFTSSGNEMSSALDVASSNYIQTVATAEKARLDLALQRQEYKKDYLTDQVEILTKKKEVLQGELDLRGFDSDAYLELQAVQQELDLLGRQQSLLLKEIEFEKTSGRAEANIETAVLQSQLGLMQAQQSLSGYEASISNSAAQIATQQAITALLQQQISNPDDDELKNEVEALRLQLELLIKELEIRGRISD